MEIEAEIEQRVLKGTKSTYSDESDYIELEELESDFGYKLYLGDKVIPIPNSIP